MENINSEDYINKEIGDKTKKDIERLKEANEKKKEVKEGLTEGLRRILLYSGYAGAGISAIAYLIITFVMIKGMTVDLDLQKQLLFSILGAVVGLLISFMLRTQGITYAKQVKHVKEVLAKYRKKKYKRNKRNRDITYYLAWATIRDIFIKGVTVAASTWLIVYIYSEGSGDWTLLGLAIANIMLFMSFGLISLAAIYDKYLNEHIPILEERIERMEEEDREKALEKEEKKKRP